MAINTVYVVEYCYGSGPLSDRRTTTRFTQDRYESFMEGLQDTFREGKISYFNAFKIMYDAGKSTQPQFVHLICRERPRAKIQELNTTLLNDNHQIKVTLE